MSFFLQLHRFHKRYTANLTTLLAPYQLSMSNWSLLHYAATHERVTTTQMAKYWDVEKPTVSANVKALVQLELLTAEPGEDKREKYLQLTKKGEQLHAEVAPQIEQFKAQLLTVLPSEQQQLFKQTLSEMESLLRGDE
ncbi:MAG: winged helix DNA-binding protein [Solibacillus sp.]